MLDIGTTKKERCDFSCQANALQAVLISEQAVPRLRSDIEALQSASQKDRQAAKKSSFKELFRLSEHLLEGTHPKRIEKHILANSVETAQSQKQLLLFLVDEHDCVDKTNAGAVKIINGLRQAE